MGTYVREAHATARDLLRVLTRGIQQHLMTASTAPSCTVTVIYHCEPFYQKSCFLMTLAAFGTVIVSPLILFTLSAKSDAIKEARDLLTTALFASGRLSYLVYIRNLVDVSLALFKLAQCLWRYTLKNYHCAAHTQHSAFKDLAHSGITVYDDLSQNVHHLRFVFSRKAVSVIAGIKLRNGELKTLFKQIFAESTGTMVSLYDASLADLTALYADTVAHATEYKDSEMTAVIQVLRKRFVLCLSSFKLAIAKAVAMHRCVATVKDLIEAAQSALTQLVDLAGVHMDDVSGMTESEEEGKIVDTPADPEAQEETEARDEKSA